MNKIQIINRQTQESKFTGAFSNNNIDFDNTSLPDGTYDVILSYDEPSRGYRGIRIFGSGNWVFYIYMNNFNRSAIQDILFRCDENINSITFFINTIPTNTGTPAYVTITANSVASTNTSYAYLPANVTIIPPVSTIFDMNIIQFSIWINDNKYS